MRGSAIHRASRIALIFAASFGIACNREARLLARANAEHASHEIDRALDTLDAIVSQAPDSREADEARKLGVAWGIEASEANVAEGRMRFLERARGFSPKSGEVAARRCRLVAEEGVEPLRACLDLDLLGKEAIPEWIVAPLRARVDAADEENEEARLAASHDPDDWRTLRKKYPSSPRAAEVEARWERRISICAWLPLPRAWLRSELDTTRDATPENVVRLAIEPRSMVTIARTRAANLHEHAVEIEAHDALDGEAPIRDLIASSVDAFSKANIVFADEVERAVDKHDLDRYSRAIAAYVHGKQALAPAIEARLAKIERACASPESIARLASHGLDASITPPASTP